MSTSKSNSSEEPIPRYTYNGKKYNSLDEMPAGVRKFFEDKDGDGRSDMFENLISLAGDNVDKTYKFNGKKYNSLDEMPADVRKIFEDKSTNKIQKIHTDESAYTQNSDQPNVKRISTRSQQSLQNHPVLIAVAVVSSLAVVSMALVYAGVISINI